MTMIIHLYQHNANHMYTYSFQGNYTDVTLACDGKFYPVHKLVLSTCSEYFSDIFDRTPCKNPVVVLKDIQCQDLEFLLDYMYIGEVNVRQNDLASLIKAAECLRIKGLAVPDDDGSKPPNSNVNTSSSSSRQRPSEVNSRDHTSPAAKRRRTEERRLSSSSSLDAPPNPPLAERSNEEPAASHVDQHDKHLHQSQQKENVSPEIVFWFQSQVNVKSMGIYIGSMLQKHRKIVLIICYMMAVKMHCPPHTNK